MPLHRAYYYSPIGPIEIIGDESGVSEVRFAGRNATGRRTPPPPTLTDAVKQLSEYFDGSRKEFSLMLRVRGREFERKAWRALGRIPFGRTASYGEVARSLGRPGAARAVGRANQRNPFVIIIPCHRIIGADGRLVGYGGGLWRKQWLLNHEKEHSRTPKRR